MVRALEGLLPIAVVGGPRHTIGRAADVDLQIIDPHVSRRHARIERDAHGAAVLVDLSSACGTFVGDARIQRHILRDGDVIGIAGVKLRYEDAPPGVTQQRPVVERGIRALRPTLRLEPITVAHVPSSPVPEVSITSVPVEPPRRPSPAGRARPAARWTPSALDLDAPATTPTVQFIPAITEPSSAFAALDEDNEELQRPIADGRLLVREVFEYRTLRMEAMRGAKLEDDALRKLRTLEERMHRHSVAERALDHLRRYHRFACDVPGWLGRRSGGAVSTMAIELEDIGAGGARVSCPERRFQVGDPCWLVVDLETDDETPLVVFRARVAWSSPEGARMGLAFAGAARSGTDALEMIRAE